jgi:hypothetical protein
MRATLTTKSGATIELDGSESEIAQVIALAVGSVDAPAVSRGRPGRPPAAASASNGRARRPVSPARRKAMQLQGAYMGIVRGLPPKHKAQVKALTKDKGVAAGLQLAKKLAASKS